MKETYYFPHDYTASRDPKILMIRSEFGLIGYALFFLVLESMAEEESGKINRVAIGGLSVSYGTSKETLIKFIDYSIEISLFIEDETGIYNNRMLEHKAWRMGQSEHGKEGARKRWHSDPNGDPNAKERKGNKRKGKKKEIQYPPEYEEFWDAYPKPLKRDKGNKEKTFKLFRAIPDNRRNDLMQATKNYNTEMAKQNNEYVKNAQNFMAVWEDYIEGYVDPKDVEGSPEWMRAKGHNHPDVVMWKTKNGIKAF